MSVRPYLRLCRIPNVFTAVADVFAGLAIVGGGTVEMRDTWLLGATACLYTSGMVLNDYFDRGVDALERPDRPIPSGEVSPRAAATLGGALLVIGLSAAAARGGRSMIVAIALAAVVLAYDAWLKKTRLGPLSMGVCRGLNFTLGLSVGAWSTGWIAGGPLVLAAFTAIVTALSRDEVGGTEARHVRRRLFGLGALLVALAALVAPLGPATTVATRFAMAAPFLVFLSIRGWLLFRPLWRDASGPTIGRAIGGGILMMPMIDATIVAGSGLVVSAAVTALIGSPGYLLRRWYYVT